jgi:hypothetical protein
MRMRAEAILALYDNVVQVSDDNGAWDIDNNVVQVDESLVATKAAQLAIEQDIQFLRAERNQRLANTDWWASSDLTMTAEQTAYRQALRDITETYTSLDNVVWPIKPE